jgi:hypothetical protein
MATFMLLRLLSFCAVLLVTCLGPASMAVAQSNQPVESYWVPENVVLLQSGENLSLEDVRSESMRDQWVRRQAPLNLGLSSQTAWIGFDIPSGTLDTRPWLLQIDNATLDEVELFITRKNPEAPLQDQHFIAGMKHSFSQRTLRDTAFVFPLDLEPDREYRAWLRVKSHFHLRIPLEIMTERHYLAHRLTERMIQGAYFGLVLIIALGSLVIYFSIRDKTYLYYFAFILAVGFWIFIRQGFAQQYLWPDAVWWNERAYLVVLALGAGLSAIFTREFLSLRKCSRLFYRLITVLSGSWVVFAGYSLLFPTIATLKVISVVLMIGGTLLLFAGFTAWRAGVMEARIYVLAWSIVIIGAISVMASHLGF